MPPETFNFTATSPEGFFLQTTLARLDIATEDGQLQILPGHDTLISVIDYSKAHAWVTENDAKELVVRHGLLSVDRQTNQVRLMAFSIDYTQDLEIKTLEEYYSSITQALETGNLNTLQIQYLEEQGASMKKLMEVSKPAKK